ALIDILRQKEWPHLGKAVGILLIGLFLAIGSGASNLLTSLEYGEQTMRGEPILEKATDQVAQSSSETDGLEWNYAMNWSNGTKDLMATFVPGAAGGGSGEQTTRSSAFGKALSRLGGRLPAEFSAPLYHGNLPFTSGPAYLGAVIWFLFILGIITVKGPLKWWLALGTLLTFFLSMGSEAAWLNRPLYDHLPLFNKFRSPSSALTVTIVLMAALGVVGLHRWKELLDSQAEKAKKQLFLAAGITGGIALFVALLGPSMVNFSRATDLSSVGRFIGQPQLSVEAGAPLLDGLEDTRKALFSGDAWRSFLFVVLSAGILFLYQRKTIGIGVLAAVLSLFVVIDFQGINTRYLEKSDFVRKRQLGQIYEPSRADEQILADQDPHFRVYNTSTGQNPFEDALPSYHHKNIGGYHPAKLQRYQDMIDRHLGQGNQAAFDMLNAKYFITRSENGPVARRNPGALGNAWLVNNIQTANTNKAEIEAINGLDPSNTAIVHQEFAENIAGLNPDGTGEVSLLSYTPNKLEYSFNSSSDQLVVFSEVWYGPNTGWKAYIDGTEAELIRANYILRALRVPAGSQKIEMRFAPQTFVLGKTVSLISSLAILLGILAYMYLWFARQPKATEVQPAAEAVPVPAPVQYQNKPPKEAKPSSKKTKKKKKK
ncbi:MAG: YfhO family protein, partial [Bacteroidota bacterium]